MAVHNLADYERRAIELATNPQELSHLKAQLLAQRHTAPLFNTGLTTQSIETAFKMMHQRHLDGLAPEHLDIPS
jgi:protein O-GlcNAc transferase